MVFQARGGSGIGSGVQTCGLPILPREPSSYGRHQTEESKQENIEEEEWRRDRDQKHKVKRKSVDREGRQ